MCATVILGLCSKESVFELTKILQKSMNGSPPKKQILPGSREVSIISGTQAHEL